MFGTSGIRGTFGESITSRLAFDVGKAVASEGASRVVVGRDSRLTGDVLEHGVTAGLREAGADVVALGVVSTPTAARAVGWEDADAGIVVTASHNPPADNGLKLWNPDGMAFSEAQREAISRRVIDEEFDVVAYDQIGSEATNEEATQTHVEAIGDRIGSLDGLEVIVDVGNGAGLVTATALDRAGADVTTLNAQPDGTFPGRPSEPTAENVTELQAMVETGEADLGVAHDGDADRMMAVDETGTFVGGDQLLAVFADAATTGGEAVSVPVNTSIAVDDFLARKDVSVRRTKVGDVHVAEQAAEDPDAVFAGEPSGAWIWPEETLCPDGPLAAGILAAEIAAEGPLSSLVERVDRYPIRRQNLEVTDKTRLIESVSERMTREFEAVETLDGVRVDTEEGWFLVRASGTEPLVRVTAEARTPDRSAELLATAVDYVESAQ